MPVLSGRRVRGAVQHLHARSSSRRRGAAAAATLGDWPTENPRGTVPALKEWAVTLQAMSEGRQHVRFIRHWRRCQPS